MKLGDTVTPERAEQLPVGAICSVTHPIYQAPNAVVRMALYDGTPVWQITGSVGVYDSEEVAQMFGRCPFVILRLPPAAQDAA